jgi:hypothetical protein
MHVADLDRPGWNQWRFGNLIEQDYRAIWRGAAFTAFRRTMSRGEMPDLCRGCVVFSDDPRLTGRAPDA